MRYARTPHCLTLAAMALVAGCGDAPTAPTAELQPAPQFAATTFSSSTRAPFVLNEFVSCAAGGVGEVISVAGSLHIVSVFVSDGSGGTHVVSHFQPAGAVGTGVTSGASYRGVGATRTVQNDPESFPFSSTSVNNFLLIGTGFAESYRVKMVTHFTVDANGRLTAFVDRARITCR